MSVQPKSWKSQIVQGLVLVLAVAVAGRLAWELLRPLVPAVIVLIGLVALFGFLLGGRW